MKSFVWILAISIGLSVGSASFADGFKCTANNGSMNVKVYDHRNAEDGTRTASRVILSNPNMQVGHRTIATFVQDQIDQDGAYYELSVDLRRTGNAGEGEDVMGTNLGEIDTFLLNIEYNFGLPVDDGTEVGGTIKAIKRDGSRIGPIALTCTRYLVRN